MLLQDLLIQLCKDLQISNIPKENKEKIYTLNITKDVQLFFKELDVGCYLWCHLLLLPKEGREDLFMLLMQANLLGQGTGNNVINLDLDEKFLTLSLALPYEINYLGFKEKLEDFVNYVIYWRKEINRVQQEKQNSLYG